MLTAEEHIQYYKDQIQWLTGILMMRGVYVTIKEAEESYHLYAERDGHRSNLTTRHLKDVLSFLEWVEENVE